MEKKPLSPKYDVVFKSIFGEKHLSVLTDFLKTVLDLPDDDYQEIRLMDPHLLRRYKKDKLGILDLRISTKNGNKIDVELQIMPQPSIWKRILYYNARLLTDQMGEGEDYEKISRAVSILISYHTLLEDRKEFHYCFRLHDVKTQIQYPDSLEINVLEVKKARGAEENSPLTNWLRFFAAETAEEFMHIAQTSPAIAEAWEVIQYLSADEEARRLAEYEEMARRDEADRQKGAYSKGLQEGEQKGLQEGLQEGERKKACAIAKSLLQEKMPAEAVVRLTGLSLEEVTRLAAEVS